MNDDEIKEFEEYGFYESEAAKTLREGDIAVIKTSNDYPYYLLKLSRDPFQTNVVQTDDFNHQFPSLTKVIEGNYFEIHKSNTDCDIYYLDTKIALISSFCVVGSCPPPEIIVQKRKGREQQMYKINSNLHQALCELVNFSDL